MVVVWYLNCIIFAVYAKRSFAVFCKRAFAVYCQQTFAVYCQQTFAVFPKIKHGQSADTLPCNGKDEHGTVPLLCRVSTEIAHGKVFFFAVFQLR
jgi:hypothetical protein